MPAVFTILIFMRMQKIFKRMPKIIKYTALYNIVLMLYSVQHYNNSILYFIIN